MHVSELDPCLLECERTILVRREVGVGVTEDGCRKVVL